jgi:CSLREA domain-containing protein
MNGYHFVVRGIETKRPRAKIGRTVLGLLVVLVAAPATADQFIVTKLTDSFDGACDGDCSLREAIAAANDHPGADEVLLLAGTHLLTVNGPGEEFCATGDLDVTDDLELIGAGVGTSIIDGSGFTNDDRVLHVRHGVVEINDLTVQGGSATGSYPDAEGGGIFNGANLTIRACDISNNAAEGGGGGIYTHDESTLVIVDSSINDNDTVFGGGINSWGGDVTLVNCDVLRNEGGGLNVGAGGPTPQDGGDLIVIDSRIQNNHTIEYGGGINLFKAHGVILDSLIEFNSADHHGGGIITQAGASFYLLRGSVSHNTAMEDGGGAYTRDLRVQGTSFVGNQANEGAGIHNGPGGYLSVEDAVFEANVISGSLGGAIYSDGTATIVGSTFVNNQAIVEAPPLLPGDGAALFVEFDSNATLVRSTVVGNTAVLCAVTVHGSLDIRSSTIAMNMTTNTWNHPSGVCGGDFGFFQSLVIGNSIVAENQINDCFGEPTSLGYNIESGSTCDFIGTGDQQFTNPMLGTFENHGGPTDTYSLLTGSPGIDHGNPVGCDDGFGGLLSLDQRAYAREVDGDGNSSIICDVGAYEYASFPARIFRDDFESTGLDEWSAYVW